MMEKVDLSVILACYNEEDILEESFHEICDILDATKYAYEIIFVDDYSQDRTRIIIDDLIKRHPGKCLRKIYHEKNIGRGFAVSNGIRQAKGRIVGFIDVDLEVHVHYLPHLAMKIDKGYDVAVGWRTYKLKWGSIRRYVATKSYKWLVNKLLKLPLNDTETGIKFFNRERILPILEEVEDRHWFWDTEIMTRSYYRNLKICEIPVLFLRRRDKNSKVRLFHDSLRQFISLWKFRKRIR